MVRVDVSNAFENWPDASRLWFYVADRELSAREQEIAERYLKDFVRDWTAHRESLVAHAAVLFSRVVVLGVDESQVGASGCSIDSSVRAVRSLGEILGVDYFNRLLFLVVDDAGEVIRMYDRPAFAAAYASGELHDSSLVVDTLVDTVAQARQSLILRLGDSWHRRMV